MSHASCRCRYSCSGLICMPSAGRAPTWNQHRGAKPLRQERLEMQLSRQRRLRIWCVRHDQVLASTVLLLKRHLTMRCMTQILRPPDRRSSDRLVPLWVRRKPGGDERPFGSRALELSWRQWCSQFAESAEIVESRSLEVHSMERRSDYADEHTWRGPQGRAWRSRGAAIAARRSRGLQIDTDEVRGRAGPGHTAIPQF